LENLVSNTKADLHFRVYTTPVEEPKFAGRFMIITLEVSGGFAPLPALSKPLTIDTAQIEPQARIELESLVRLSRFFDQPLRGLTPAKGAADYRIYTITVQDGPHAHTIQLTDPITDINLEQLVSRLRVIPRKTTP
jgi:hypothetical protein